MTERLEDIAIAMVASGKGILAADESSGTIKKRFDSINLTSTEDARRDYREMLFRADDAMKNYISGVILTMKPSARKPRTARRSQRSSAMRVRFRASRSMLVQRRWPVSRVKPSPKVWTACANA